MIFSTITITVMFIGATNKMGILRNNMNSRKVFTTTGSSQINQSQLFFTVTACIIRTIMHMQALRMVTTVAIITEIIFTGQYSVTNITIRRIRFID
jgi:hypothetical protein